jgi:uncharacterized protein
MVETVHDVVRLRLTVRAGRPPAYSEPRPCPLTAHNDGEEVGEEGPAHRGRWDWATIHTSPNGLSWSDCHGRRLATPYPSVWCTTMFRFLAASYATATDPDGPFRAGSRRIRSHPRRDHRPTRLGQLLAGLLLVGLGVALVIRAELGAASWDVVHVGVAESTGWSIGVAVMASGVVAIGIARLLGERARVGSFVPLVVVGPTIDLSLAHIRPADTLGGQTALLAVGMLVIAVGIGSYVTSDHGAGPGDLVFLAVANKGMPLPLARVVVDGGAVLVGWSIGGPVGVGTLILTLGLGPLIATTIRIFDLLPAREATRVHALEVDRAQDRELAWELDG